MVYAIEMASGGMIYIPIFMKFGTDVQAMLRFFPSNIKGCNAGFTDGRNL
jgi:hypothetical protein